MRRSFSVIALVTLSLGRAIFCAPPMHARSKDHRPAGEPREVVLAAERKVTPKIVYGLGLLAASLEQAGIKLRGPHESLRGGKQHVIRIEVAPQWLAAGGKSQEGFEIASGASETTVTGFDEAGALYGCQELASRIRRENGLPKDLHPADSPKMTLRGVPLFLMTAGSYDFPITERQFPWFYDKALWTKTLDFLFEHRFNYISFWNGHPFPYFLKLARYPEVKELSDAELGQNIELMGWLSREAEKRNIWLLFHFYNIHLPRSFAEAHGIPRNRFFNGYTVSEPNPLVSDYTRYCVREFISKYPSVGLYFPLAEALQKDKSYWMNEVLLAGVKDTGKSPPVILRQHDIGGVDVLEKALAVYDNLYTEMKHNDELYTVPQPLPGNADWIKRSRRHIINVHLMGNLKPFRWAPPSFIRETALAQQMMGARGLQVYPLWVWNWPVSADRERLLQIDRDWLWYAAWGRYGWDADRASEQEDAHWRNEIALRYGAKAAPHVLDAYESAGRVMTWVPRLFWFRGWNHWFASNGLTLDQVLKSNPYPFDNVPKTISVSEYARLEADGESPAAGMITPVEVTRDMVTNAQEAAEACRRAGSLVELNREELERLVADVEATRFIARFYQSKVEAAIRFVAYQKTPESAKAKQVLESLEESVSIYRELARTTENAYPIANDIRNDMPFPFYPPTGIAPLESHGIPHLPHWRDFLVVFEAELDTYRKLIGEHGGVLTQSGKVPEK